MKTSSSSRDQLRAVAPKLVELTEEVVFGDVWERPDLSKRERSIATVTALITSARWDQLNGHLERAANNGVSKAEIFELITHLAFYAGWPSAMTAASKAKEFYEKRDAQK